jgi:coatomer protein complex subunit epsilon
MIEPDELYTLRNLFWLGNYQLAINETNNMRLPANLVTEKEEYVYRSYLALGQYQMILSEIKDTENVPVSLRAVKLLATVMSDPSSKEIALLQLQEWLSDPAAASNTSLQLIAAILYILDDNVKEAIKLMHHGVNMEQNALLVQLFLRIDRQDLAQKQVKLMKSVDEDCTLTMLASAYIHLSLGTAKGSQDATYVFEELIDKYGGSALLLNNLAVAKMHQGHYDEAESSLQVTLTLTLSRTLRQILFKLNLISTLTVWLTLTDHPMCNIERMISPSST